jgi:hypothetical protein
MPPEAGLGRRTASADRLEAEPLDFHRRVRAGFLALSRAEPERYLVIDASRQPEDVSEEIKDRIREILPDPVPHTAEAATGSFPAITADFDPRADHRGDHHGDFRGDYGANGASSPHPANGASPRPKHRR